METLFIYFLKSSGLIAMFYLAYFFLLRKETFFNSNRWFLLAGLITSVVLPLIVFTKIVWADPSPTNFDWSKIPITTTIIEKKTFEINWYLIAAILYSIGILGFLIKFAFDFYSLSKVLKGKTVKRQADFKFIDVTENISPFSYFNAIVYNSSLYSATELENILEHEKVHSAQNHTVDVLISRLFCIVFWFNPLVWLYKKSIVQNLEFIADSEASKIISNKKAYQLTLLKITTQENCVAITNHFYQSLIKKRIVMLNKNQSHKRNSWKYAVVLPLLGAFLFFFQVKVVAQEKVVSTEETNTNEVEIKVVKIENDINSLAKGKEIYIDGEKSTEDELTKLDPTKIKSIVVNKKESKSNIEIDTKNALKPVKITDKEIYINGIKSTNEEFSKLDQKNIDKIDLNAFENTVRILTKSEKPLIIVDGIRKESNFKVEDLSTNEIKEVNVLKGKLAEDKYGEKGKNGVIEITTKEANSDNSKESQKNLVVGYETKQDKVVNGWKVSSIPATKNMIELIKEDKKIDYKKAIIIIDGKLSSPKNIESLNPDKIVSVYNQTIAEGTEKQKEAAVKKYGDKALNGIITIETKK